MGRPVVINGREINMNDVVSIESNSEWSVTVGENDSVVVNRLDLKAENAKLRELVSSYASMSKYLLARQPMLLPDKANELQELDEKRRELGIEV